MVLVFIFPDTLNHCHDCLYACHLSPGQLKPGKNVHLIVLYTVLFVSIENLLQKQEAHGVKKVFSHYICDPLIFSTNFIRFLQISRFMKVKLLFFYMHFDFVVIFFLWVPYRISCICFYIDFD